MTLHSGVMCGQKMLWTDRWMDESHSYNSLSASPGGGGGGGGGGEIKKIQDRVH